MRLPDFITANLDPILDEWEVFARTRLPAAATMEEDGLRDHARSLLSEIVLNMGQEESAAQQKDKSQDLGQASDAATSAPRAHALQRARSGFQTVQMVAEFRALRATVLRLWSQSGHAVRTGDMDDVTRFNEALDQALAESLLHFVGEVDHPRHLFMAVLGHDIRGPLSAIILGTQSELRRRPESGSWANALLRSAAQIKALTNDLLVFARTRLGSPMPLAIDAFDLGVFAREVLEEIAESSRRRHVDIEVSGDVKGVWDAKRLHQVLSNLVFNALKYGDSERPIKVSVRGEDPGSVRICVHNFGSPISSQNLLRVFDSLVRATSETGDDQPSGANLGLGLYITREIVTAHGGKIAATSSVGAGTEFEVTLPRVVRQPSCASGVLYPAHAVPGAQATSQANAG